MPGAEEGYLRKALTCVKWMDRAAAEGDWDVACREGVNATILATDALASRRLRVHSTAQGHDEAALLVRGSGVAGAREKAKLFIQILTLKQLAQYEFRSVSEAEGRILVKQVHRFVDWVRKSLEQPTT